MAGIVTVRVICNDCGDRTIFADDITIRLCTDNRQATYAFLCPTCGLRTCRALRASVFLWLLAQGFSYSPWLFPDELGDIRRDDHRPFTMADVIGFGVMLDSADTIGQWVDKLR